LGHRVFYFGLRSERAVSVGVAALSKEQRRKLIDMLSPTQAVSELAGSLVSGDRDLFKHLLSRPELGDIRLTPLRLNHDMAGKEKVIATEFGLPWKQMAKMA